MTTSIYIHNPPAILPEAGTREYDAIVEQIGGPEIVQLLESWTQDSYESYIAQTRALQEEPEPITFTEPAPNGAPIADIYLINPPSTMPEKGTEDYALLLLETNGASASWLPGSSIAGHIAATRPPEMSKLVALPTGTLQGSASFLGSEVATPWHLQHQYTPR